MKSELLKIIRWPCQHGNPDLFIGNENSLEIVEGKLVCPICQSCYPIQNGILDLVSHAKSSDDETTGWLSFAEKEGWLDPQPSYLASLPFTMAKSLLPGDTMTWDRHGRNFFRTLSHLDLNGKNVLDLGAGRCWTTKFLALMRANCVATDLVVEKGVGLKTAEFFFRESRIYFERVRCDMRLLPFLNSSFSIVFAQGAIHHSSNLKASFMEAARVLAPGGCLVLTNESCSPPKGVENLPLPEMPGIHEHNYRGYRQLKWLFQAGFRSFEIVPDVYYFNETDSYYVPFARWAKIHPFFMKIKLLFYGGIFNLIAKKTK